MTLEDWIAVATIATGSAVSMGAVWLGYRLQRGTSKRERLLEIAAKTVADAERYVVLVEDRQTVSQLQEEVSSWSNEPTPGQLAKLRQVVATSRVLVGESVADVFNDDSLITLDGSRARRLVNEAWVSSSRGIIEAHMAIGLDAASLDLLRPELDIGASVNDFTGFVLRSVKVTSDSSELDELLRPRLADLKALLRQCLH